MHARGIEHHSHGVENVLSTINIVLASGRIGRPYCAYGTVVGQGNGQGGREHGQKADQLPGWRDISNPQHREYIASVWGVKPEEIPQAGVDCYEMMRKIDSGEIKGLINICFNPVVSLPDNAFVKRMLEKLERVDRPEDVWARAERVRFRFAEAQRSGDIVLEAAALFGGISQLVKAVGQLQSIHVCLEAGRHWSTNLRERSL